MRGPRAARARLAPGAAGRAQEDVLRELLRQRGAALHHVAGGEVGVQGADEADRVQAEMLAEAAILDGEQGGGQMRRQVAQAQRLAFARGQVVSGGQV